VTKLGGDVAIEVTHQLAEPLRALRDRLGLVVDHLERFVSTSTGPTPYPWRSLQILRQDLAETYLEVTQLARRVDELDRALLDDAVHWFDLQATVDLALRLAQHHLPDGIELLFDLGTAPPTRGAPGTLALLVAQLVAVSADSARATAGSSLSVRISAEDAWGVITIADNGNGSDRVAELGDLARSIVTPWGGNVEAASAAGQGCAFELRLVTQPV
jgi:signal transduction histidine kinase